VSNDPPGTTHRNQGCDYREQLGPQADGLRLVDYLSQRYHHSSPDEWADHIAAGLVVLNGSAAQPDQLLSAGQELVWQRPAWDEPAAPRWFGLLYDDADLLAVAKPAGLPTLPGANFLESTLLYLVQQQYPAAAPLHRLGRWTSGLVLCAKHPDARRALLRQWSARQVGKRYRALVSGLPVWDRLTIETPIGPVDHPLLGTLHAASPHGKPARSEVTVLERRDGYSLCDVTIDTGRPHQIRIHLASVGHPLQGDPLYLAGGRPAPDSTALPGDPGYLLHSAELRFCHPRSGQPTVISCPPPPELRSRLEGV
jgi:23S rRNA pseudouridine1911/1915/1917 synthase